MVSKANMVDCLVIGSFPVIGAVTAIATGKVVEKYGHSFIQIGPKNSLVLGVIGAIQNAMMLLCAVQFPLFEGHQDSLPASLITYNVLVTSSLFTAYALAAKVNLVASRLYLPGTCLLIAANVVASTGLIYAGLQIGG